MTTTPANLAAPLIASGLVDCDYCGARHRAQYDHDGRYGEGPIYAVVCDDPTARRLSVIDYYTLERLITAPAEEPLDLSARPDPRPGRARHTDPDTSHAGAESIALRSGSQKARLLSAYYAAGAHGLTDDEAACTTGLDRSCFWKRCGELRQDGLIYELGITRRGPLHGEARMVCAITHTGIEALA